MKKKFVCINAILAIAVLFSILFQSLHSIEHLTLQLFEKKCVHKHHSVEEITHQHHNFEHCLVCEISFSNYIPTATFSLQFQFAPKPNPIFFSFTQTVISFRGSDYSLRGPPQFIV